MLKRSVVVLAFIFSASSAYGHICGDQDTDNRPNHCEVKKDEVWVHQMSSCKVVEPGKCLYTHCSGSTKLIEDPQCCCLESKDCPGATYVGVCVGTNQSLASTGGYPMTPGERCHKPGASRMSPGGRCPTRGACCKSPGEWCPKRGA